MSRRSGSAAISRFHSRQTQILEAARRAKIPVFTALPPKVDQGALFDLGADYLEVGRSVGNLAADVLDGKKNPAEMPIENFLPEVFLLNETVPESLKDTWTITENLRRRAKDSINAVSPKLTVPKTPSASAPAWPHLQDRSCVFAPEAGAEACMRGIFDGLLEQGFEEGRNLEVRRAARPRRNRQHSGNAPKLRRSDVDVILPMSTPVISSALWLRQTQASCLYLLFGPYRCWRGQVFTKHLPNVTGIGSFPPVQDMVDIIHHTMPQAETIGTIYNASEANSVKVIAVARGLFSAAGMKLDEVTVASSAEVLAGCPGTS